MTKHIIETVTFRLKDGVKPADFAKSATAMNAYVSGCTGFIARRLSYNADGLWIEHIEWQDMDAAKAAAAGIGAPEGNRPFLSAIDGPTVTMTHTELEVSVN
ncbi:hypothetical protein SAMN05444149_103530 [Pseudosulfitobacter pseudonitzschiae]|uniref:Antibiotic biosynthesis monooxygenase n=1 Tax=Pseudosulfitobacter pseudonitzschiae TaxID=1402135 RepID=A0A073J1X7_9RHOB|nr:hypothetical protein [Pseudosulfitobacter pseudonitzschiae]KEJ96573.1 hypothetical protein SUH3_14545 [Pseudosulfitobacter pseudonitzschiae]QKS07963.1 hypothetical protein HT745_05385 [Pseudosulfitobacter pseudonitzschiae]SHF30662.1 hypothetical protein SAMN05444149_103530 [Pseudosulfitobacter pseudonitzschiae]